MSVVNRMRRMIQRTTLVAVMAWFAPCLSADLRAQESPENEPEFTADQIEFFEQRIRPLLVQHCFECHGSDAESIEAGLRLDSRSLVLRGGESGAAVSPGQADQSLLIGAVKYESLEMPPTHKLADQEIADLVRWVNEGVAWPADSAPADVAPLTTAIDWDRARQEHWAWRPIAQPASRRFGFGLVSRPD
ncbi:MAG: c-type cytochrome domain-containing protein [Pirellulaceae bacterium]